MPTDASQSNSYPDFKVYLNSPPWGGQALAVSAARGYPRERVRGDGLKSLTLLPTLVAVWQFWRLGNRCDALEVVPSHRKALGIYR
jgi:hypothetical protein